MRPMTPGCPVIRTLQISEDEPTEFVRYDKFEKKMLELLESQEFAPDTEDTLLQAFRVRVQVCDGCMSHVSSAGN